jgi:hypothetical protein
MHKTQRSSRCRESRRAAIDPPWVPISLPPNLEEMFDAWLEHPGPNVGWCLQCNGPIESESDLIEGTNTHDCKQGRLFEESHITSYS